MHHPAYPFSTGSSGVSSVNDARGSVRMIAGALSVGRLVAADPTVALLEVS